jgi:hypothetical protein
MGAEDWGHEDCSVCDEARNAPTPEKLEEWAEWFDNPNEVGLVAVDPINSGKKYLTAGYVLRRVADAFRALEEKKGER